MHGDSVLAVHTYGCALCMNLKGFTEEGTWGLLLDSCFVFTAVFKAVDVLRLLVFLYAWESASHFSRSSKCTLHLYWNVLWGCCTFGSWEGWETETGTGFHARSGRITQTAAKYFL